MFSHHPLSAAAIGLKWLVLGTEMSRTPSFIHAGLNDSPTPILLDTDTRKKILQLLFVYVKPGVSWSVKARTIVGHHSNG